MNILIRLLRKPQCYQSVSEIKRLFEDPDDTQESRLTLESSQTKGSISSIPLYARNN